MTFHVGQRVMCVDDVPSFKYTAGPAVLIPSNVVAGRVYVVSGVCICYNESRERVWLDGVVRPWKVDTLHPENVPLSAGRFRPVQETGMQILLSILANPKQTVDA